MQLILLAYGLGALVLFKIAQSYISKYQHSRRAKALGCAPPPVYPGGFLGLKTLRGAQAADRDWRLMPWILERFDEMSLRLGRPASTWMFSTLGTDAIHTTDPENIKAILATQFEDFGLGLRRPNMMPFLGDGIVRFQSFSHVKAVADCVAVCARRESLGTLEIYAEGESSPFVTNIDHETVTDFIEAQLRPRPGC